ncbi:hypothetical protein CH296_09610 [Rhodococcus sp. 14-2496-1d]|nr:hypothetical protein CH296_09610 [Rhodococcus sp. 14-2496-1d]
MDQPDGSAVVHSRSLDECSRATVPSPSSARAHVPNRVRGDFDGQPFEDHNAASVASSSDSRYGHFVPRWSSRRGYSNRPILSTFTTIGARLSGVSRIVVGKIVHEPGPAVVYLRIPSTPIFANIESDSDGRMSCPTYMPSAGSSAHTLRDRCPSLFLR